MARKTKTRRNRQVADSYFELVAEFPLLSIKSQDQLDAAQSMVDRLVTAGQFDEGTELYLDALSDLVAAYEDVHYPITPASDAEMLRHLMDAKGITQADLHRQTGIAKSSISELLAGKKSLTRAMIGVFAAFFEVDPSVLTSNLVQTKNARE